MTRPIHPDFARVLRRKDAALVALFTDLRRFVLELAPQSNELLYHTHALTTVRPTKAIGKTISKITP